jgi:hypothetical protein
MLGLRQPTSLLSPETRDKIFAEILRIVETTPEGPEVVSRYCSYLLACGLDVRSVPVQMYLSTVRERLSSESSGASTPTMSPCEPQERGRSTNVNATRSCDETLKGSVSHPQHKGKQRVDSRAPSPLSVGHEDYDGDGTESH